MTLEATCAIAAKVSFLTQMEVLAMVCACATHTVIHVLFKRVVSHYHAGVHNVLWPDLNYILFKGHQACKQ